MKRCRGVGRGGSGIKIDYVEGVGCCVLSGMEVSHRAVYLWGVEWSLIWIVGSWCGDK